MLCYVIPDKFNLGILGKWNWQVSRMRRKGERMEEKKGRSREGQGESPRYTYLPT